MECCHCNQSITYDGNAINNLLSKLPSPDHKEIQKIICNIYHGSYINVPITILFQETYLLNSLEENINKLYHDSQTWIKIDKGFKGETDLDIYGIVQELYKIKELLKLSRKLNQK